MFLSSSRQERARNREYLYQTLSRQSVRTYMRDAIFADDIVSAMITFFYAFEVGTA